MAVQLRMQIGSSAVFRRYFRPAFANILLSLLLSIALMPQQAPAAGTEAGKITFVQGEAGCSRPGGGKISALRAGDSFLVGDLLETGKDSRLQVVLSDDTVVNMSSGTALRLTQYAFDPAGNRRTAVLKVLSGQARVIAYKERNRESSLKVVTDHALVTFGRADLVIVAVGSDAAITVLDGEATVKNSSNLVVGRVVLRQNETTEVKEKSPPSVPSVITSQQRRSYSKDARNF